MTVNRLLARLMPAMFRSSTIKTIIVAVVGMTGSQFIYGALKGRLTTMSAAESIAAGSVIVSGGIPGCRAVPAKLRHHLRENRLMARAGGRPVRVCVLLGSLLAAAQLCRHLLDQRLVPATACLRRGVLPQCLLPRSIVANSQLRHRLFQRCPMSVNGSQLKRHLLDVWSLRGSWRLMPVLLAARLHMRKALVCDVRPLGLNLRELLLRCFDPLQFLKALLRSCCGLLHLLNALLCSVSFLQALSGSFGLLDALLRPPQRSLRLPVVARTLAA
jgi:hypothetical protein